MKINKIMPSIMAIIMITLLALATNSCATTDKMVGMNYNHSKYCPAYN